MANRLAAETSPYLLQHKDNPVDWYPWGEEARQRAAELDRPILLSIGYSSCHWCHVMERESFENDEIAALMNESFICIKVDREERPDVDAIYMEAVQAMTGHGGWPLTAFCDPAGVPFYMGTYFPPEQRQGMASFPMVLEAVAQSWRSQRDQIRDAAERIREQLSASARIDPAPEAVPAGLLDAAVEQFRATADMRNGGFGSAPKFPPASALEFLLARGETEVVELTLDRIAAGGINDQIGGGFARYSVDPVWLVPHFEKMLYDNALLARVYVHGYQALGHSRWRQTAERTLDWMLVEMRGEEGGFFSALDADSEGVEGKFYVWTPAEIREVLGPDAEAVIDYYGVTEDGNFEGANILHLPAGFAAEPPAGIDEARRALYEVRSRRVWPGLDDKRLLAWNALAIAALADAGAVLGRDDYLNAAGEAAQFVWDSMRDAEGNLLRTWKDGEAKLNAYLEDHAFLVEALLALYESSFEQRWFDAARETADRMIARFADPERGGFFMTSDDHEELITRRKDLDDHPIPSGSSSAAYGLLRLEALTGEASYGDHARSVFALYARVATRHPSAVAHLLRAIDFDQASIREVALVAREDVGELAELAAVVRGELRPHLVLAGGSEGTKSPELMEGRRALDGRPAAYVCQRFVCQVPVAEPGQLAATLAG